MTPDNENNNDTENDNTQDPLSPATLGARIQRLRLRQGLSVRDVALKADVDKNTVLRLEKGLPTSARTRDRIGLALGTYISRLTLPDPEEFEVLAQHTRAKETWWPYPGMGEPQPLNGENSDDETEENARLTAATHGFVTSLACRMPRGRLRSSLIKVYEETPSNTHFGEEFVFCLRGAARITVAGMAHLLEEGDAVTFWCAEPHTYAPASGTIPLDQPPVLLLSVWIDAHEERK